MEYFVTGLHEGVELPDFSEDSIKLQESCSDTFHISTLECVDENEGKLHTRLPER